jgi:hypothetical protein
MCKFMPLVGVQFPLPYSLRLGAYKVVWTKPFEFFEIATVELLDGAYSYSANAGETFTVETGEFVVDGADLNINVRMNPVGVPANILSMLEAYPNPFSSHVTIKNADWVTRVVFTNIIGQKVADVTLPGVDVFTIYTNQLEKGIYLVIFQGNNGEKVIRKMVKE